MTLAALRDGGKRALAAALVDLERDGDSAPALALLDEAGVGELVEIGVTRGRKAKPGLKIGICGEHGGDPASVAFCHDAGLDYVSCSPFRVPSARLAAAQAAIREREKSA